MPQLIDPNDVMFTQFEPKVQNRFIMYIEGIPAYTIKAAVRTCKEPPFLVKNNNNQKRKFKQRICSLVSN